jgi:hypothetical protein
MIIALLLCALLLAYLVVDYLVLKRFFEESHNRINDKLRDMMDGVKAFFTVTLIKLFDTDDVDDSEESDAESDEFLSE